jgi:predicted nucleic acid-binding protein
LFIYLFEDHGALGDQVVRIRRQMLDRGDILVTSWLCAGEVLVRPRRENNELLLRRYDTVFRDPSVEVVPFDQRAALIYADLRARFAVRQPDAMHLACAGSASVNLFVTNDSRLHRLNVPGIDFICGLDRVPM